MKRELCTHPGCFVCGPGESNPEGLHLSIFWDSEEKKTSLEFTPLSFWNGFSGITHGGILSSLLDDLMAWAVKKSTGRWAATGTMKTTFRAPVEIGKSYRGYGFVRKEGSRKVQTTAYIEDSQGTLCVESEALFFYLPENPEKPKEE
ncbi:MAG TPA: PaaI family thioesterase, partial [Synergistaceae bacterium]|nr:PaaI family thioesterase [Synergistaceae bacterium]HPJ24881.1 PaaI family thioesterase [Synergistaceae bacterium]HPQ37104.1 PaaI family thioesterase [Synergistaceae bacterium]